MKERWVPGSWGKCVLHRMGKDKRWIKLDAIIAERLKGLSAQKWFFKLWHGWLLTMVYILTLFFPEIKSMSELDQCSNACFVSHVLVFKNSLTECFKMCFNLKTQCSWNMMIGQKLKKYLESNSNCPEMYCGFIYLCFEWSRGALKWMKGAASKRRKKVVYSILTLKASRRSFASKFIPFKA